jgi:electron transfer flavoprotein alpha subunit
MAKRAEILIEALEEQPGDLETKLIKVIEADPEDLDIDEADIIVSGGRGVGKDEAFGIIHDLARTIGGSVAATRPVIDWQTLPYERQIGQTGKTVIPRLIINCGISGANEYTAGMEKSQLVIAINTDSRARIFRFADLGIIGDVHEIVPILIERLEEMKESGD